METPISFWWVLVGAGVPAFFAFALIVLMPIIREVAMSTPEFQAKLDEFGALLDATSKEERDKRVAAARTPPEAWEAIESAPKNGALLDVRFDITSADPHAAEDYAPGSTRVVNAAKPVVENVAYANGAFKCVYDAEGARSAASLAGAPGKVTGLVYGLTGVTLTHWRPAAYPFIE